MGFNFVDNKGCGTSKRQDEASSFEDMALNSGWEDAGVVCSNAVAVGRFLTRSVLRL
jgi:hypothetical protein